MPLCLQTFAHSRRFWLGLCGGLSIKDGLVVAAWVAYNAAWYAAIVTHSVANAAHSESGLTARHIGSTMASLISTNLIPLLFPVSRSVGCLGPDITNLTVQTSGQIEPPWFFVRVSTACFALQHVKRGCSCCQLLTTVCCIFYGLCIATGAPLFAMRSAYRTLRGSGEEVLQ